MSDGGFSLVTSLLVAIGGLGGLGALLLVPLNRRNIASQANKEAASAVQILAGSAVSTVEVLQRQIDRVEAMQTQLTSLRGQLSEAEAKTRELIKELDEANLRVKLAEAENVRLRDELAARRRSDPPLGAPRRPRRKSEGGGTS